MQIVQQKPRVRKFFGCGFFLTIDHCSFFTYIGAFLLTALASLLTVGAFCLQCDNAFNKGLQGL